MRSICSAGFEKERTRSQLRSGRWRRSYRIMIMISKFSGLPSEPIGNRCKQTNKQILRMSANKLLKPIYSFFLNSAFIPFFQYQELTSIVLCFHLIFIDFLSNISTPSPITCLPSIVLCCHYHKLSREGNIHHCFPLNGNLRQPNCQVDCRFLKLNKNDQTFRGWRDCCAATRRTWTLSRWLNPPTSARCSIVHWQLYLISLQEILLDKTTSQTFKRFENIKVS